MKRTFTVETGKPDKQGDVIVPSGMKNLPSERVWLLEDHNANKPISKVSAFVDDSDNTLKVTAEIDDKYLNAYPAIGYQIIKSHPNEYGGKTITEAKLFEVSLVPESPDDHLKSIKEQTA